MGRLLLVRHAQASFLAADYDKLSPVGQTQARMLGEYWKQRKVAFDRVCSGPRVRQRDTAKILAEGYRESGVSFPEPVVMPEFDEYEAEAVFKKALPQMIESDSGIRAFHQAFLASGNADEQRNNFQRMFEIVIGKWVGGEISVPGVESWSEFCTRVNRGLAQFMSAAGPGEHSAIISSGGPIAVAMQRALNLSPQDTLQISWMCRNCSFSEFLFTDDRFTLSTFNAFPHLDDPSLLTYR
jgi:broad specificity phosphatase PhoE